MRNSMGIKKVIAVVSIAITLCLVACNDTYIPDGPVDASTPIQFQLSGISVQSRSGSAMAEPEVVLVAGGAHITVSSMPLTASRAAVVSGTDKMQSFGVYAHRTEDGSRHSFYFANQQTFVTADGSCSMAASYPWPDDKSVLQFYAYHPYNSNNITLPADAGEEFAFGYQVPQNMADQEDLMVSKSYTFTGDAYTAVPLHFSHLCAQVAVRLDDGLEDFQIKSVSLLNVRDKGTYTFDSGWQLHESVSDFGGLAADAAEGGFVFMMLPQQTDASAELHVTIHNHISGTDQTYGMSLGQEWLQGHRITYLVSLTPEFNLQFVSETQPQDAHYVIYPINIHAEEIAVGWTLQSDSEWATVTSSLTDLQKHGFWIEDDKGTATVSGKQSVEDIPLYVFLTENTGNAPRTATLNLYPTGYPQAARHFKVTQQPVQRSGGVGFECYEDDFGTERIANPIYPYGFYWDRYVTYTSSDFFYRLIIHWSAQDAISDYSASSYVSSVYKFLNKTTVTIDYSKLNDLGDNAQDTDTGIGNTYNLYNFRGVGNISEIETVFDGWNINKDFTGGEIDEVQRFAAKVALLKNKFTKQQETESSGGTSVTYDVPVINAEDVVWYLPVAAEYALMSSSSFPLSGNYWTSEAVTDNVRAVSYTVGGGSSQQLRTDEYRIRCARK